MLRERARAKVNIDLHITGKRADGYHTLDSQVVFPEFGDALQFESAAALSLKVEGEFAGLAGDSENNLVLRAARALNVLAGTDHGAAITLTKHIPVGAGLGGGSADAAAALRGLNQLWGLHYPMQALEPVALALGADVPMCLYSVPMRVGGIGEQLRIDDRLTQHAWMLLVYPHQKLDTARVFAAYQSDHAPMANDLQPAAISLCPVISDVLEALTIHGGSAPRMTGSGSCCFAMFHEEAAAKRSAQALAAEHPQWWVKVLEVAV